MKSTVFLTIISALTLVNCATVPESPWTALTPTASLDPSVKALSSFDGSFALAVVTLSANGVNATTTGVIKREAATQIADGQLQQLTETEGNVPIATTLGQQDAESIQGLIQQLSSPQLNQENLLTQIGDGQLQQSSGSVPTEIPTPTTDSLLAQISDGQPQEQSIVAPLLQTASVLGQISDGQVQQQTTASLLAQIGDGQIQQQTTADVLAQISDGQVQQQTVKPSSASVLAQITDGQVQQQTTVAPAPTDSVLANISDVQIQQTATAAAIVNFGQLSDGQIQDQSTAAGLSQIPDGQLQDLSTAPGLNQISDGQFQQTTSAEIQSAQITDGQIQATASASFDSSGFGQTCAAPNSLQVHLNNGVLTDSQGRIGAIVANRQFQFDGPPPQSGTIYAGGWSIVPLDFQDGSTSTTGGQYGKLALGQQTTFYRCLSGDFYNLYDQSIGGQCSEVEFTVLKIVSC